jgi:transcriptional regulator
VLKGNGPYGVIECHLARANPHWKDLAEGNEALMIFQGPEGYITANWYPSKTLHGKVVPTWNYAVVHAYGRPEVMKDKDWLHRHVSELTAQQERNEAEPWTLSDAPASYIDAMLRGIVGFRFAITRLEGKWKMSQNRDATVTALRKVSGNQMTATIWRWRRSSCVTPSRAVDAPAGEPNMLSSELCAEHRFAPAR